MNIDWKEVSRSPGYVSLKKSVITDIKRNTSLRNKQEVYKKFQWVIGRAQHYAHHLNKSFIDVLNEWESKRNYSWHNFYQDYNLPLLIPKSPHVKPKSLKNYYKKDSWYDKGTRKKLTVKELIRRDKLKSKRKDKKARWCMPRKRRHKELAEYRKK